MNPAGTGPVGFMPIQPNSNNSNIQSQTQLQSGQSQSQSQFQNIKNLNNNNIINNTNNNTTSTPNTNNNNNNNNINTNSSSSNNNKGNVNVNAPPINYGPGSEFSTSKTSVYNWTDSEVTNYLKTRGFDLAMKKTDLLKNQVKFFPDIAKQVIFKQTHIAPSSDREILTASLNASQVEVPHLLKKVSDEEVNNYKAVFKFADNIGQKMLRNEKFLNEINSFLALPKPSTIAEQKKFLLPFNREENVKTFQKHFSQFMTKHNLVDIQNEGKFINQASVQIKVQNILAKYKLTLNSSGSNDLIQFILYATQQHLRSVIESIIKQSKLRHDFHKSTLPHTILDHPKCIIDILKKKGQERMKAFQQKPFKRSFQEMLANSSLIDSNKDYGFSLIKSSSTDSPHPPSSNPEDISYSALIEALRDTSQAVNLPSVFKKQKTHLDTSPVLSSSVMNSLNNSSSSTNSNASIDSLLPPSKFNSKLDPLSKPKTSNNNNTTMNIQTIDVIRGLEDMPYFNKSPLLYQLQFLLHPRYAENKHMTIQKDLSLQRVFLPPDGASNNNNNNNNNSSTVNVSNSNTSFNGQNLQNPSRPNQGGQGQAQVPPPAQINNLTTMNTINFANQINNVNNAMNQNRFPFNNTNNNVANSNNMNTNPTNNNIIAPNQGNNINNVTPLMNNANNNKTGVPGNPMNVYSNVVFVNNNAMNQMNQINQINQLNQINQINSMNQMMWTYPFNPVQMQMNPLQGSQVQNAQTLQPIQAQPPQSQVVTNPNPSGQQ